MSFAQLLKRKKQSSTYQNALENSGKSRGGGPIPIDTVVDAYPEEITEHTTSSGGMRLSVKFKVSGGDYDDRTIYHNLNIDCPRSADAEERAWEEYHIIRQAGGHDEDAHYSKFVNTMVRLRVWDHEKRDNGYTAERINVWQPDKKSAPVKDVPRRQPQQAAQSSGFNSVFDDDDVPF